jgi:hypothetical protein
MGLPPDWVCSRDKKAQPEQPRFRRSALIYGAQFAFSTGDNAVKTVTSG